MTACAPTAAWVEAQEQGMLPLEGFDVTQIHDAIIVVDADGEAPYWELD